MKMEDVQVVEHQAIEGGYRLITLKVPGMIPLIRPGQFVHLKIPRFDIAVLRRPFSIFRAEGENLTILYKPVGKGTEAMTRIGVGSVLSLMGPLGNGFPVDLPVERFPVLVAGGYGLAHLYLLASRLPVKGILFAGASKASDVLCVRDFENLGWPVHIATDDGSLGMKGFVTSVLNAWLEKRPSGSIPEFYACGPDGMLKAVGTMAIKNGWKAWLSLDKHMGCGVGACLACVQKLKDPDGNEKWGRVCRDGPIFEARQIVWDG